MATDTERLVVSVEARVNQLEREMRKAARISSKTFDDMQQGAERAASRMEQAMSQAASKVGGTLKNFAAGFAGGFIAGGIEGIISNVRDIARSVAQVGDEAKKAGLSIRQFQELKYVAEQNRIGVDALTDGMKELSLRADEFITTGGGSAAESFQRLGFSALELKERLKNPSELLLEIIKRLQTLDEAAQIRIFDELMGGGGEQFVQLISQGEQGIRKMIQAAHESGAVMSDEMIAKADEIDRKFNQMATTMGSAVKGAIISAVSALQDMKSLLESMPGYRGPEAVAAAHETIQRELAEQEITKQRETHFRRIKDLQDTITKNNELGFDNTDALNQLRAEQDRLRALDAMIERQKALNAEKERTVELDTVTVPGSFNSDDKGNYREFQQIPLPDSVSTTPDRRVDPYFAPADSVSGSKTGDSTVMSLIKKFEGFITKAQWDVNHFRVGFGSDTTTRANGSVEKVTASTTVSLADANRDLARRILEFQNTIKGQIGGDTWASFSEEQQAALTSVAYNYGDLPDRIVAAIQAGDPEKIGIAIRNLGDDNEGVNRKRRAQEADMFASGSGSGNTPHVAVATAQLKLNEQAADNLKQRYDALGQAGIGAFQGIANALADGKIDASELISILGQLIQQLLQMASMPGGFSGQGGFGSLLGGLFGGGSKAFVPNTNFGAVLGLAGGGRVRGPGTGTSDSIRANLSNGEYVINAEATRRNLPLIEAINSGSTLNLAKGGPVGRINAGGSNSSIVYSPTINVQGGASDKPEDREAFAKELMKQMDRSLDQRISGWAINQQRPGGMMTKKELMA